MARKEPRFGFTSTSTLRFTDEAFTLFRTVGPLLLGLALGAMGAWAFLARSGPIDVTTTGENSDGDSLPAEDLPVKRAVYALGTIQPRDGAVLVSSPQVGALIQAVKVREGQAVEAGELLIELDAIMAEHELRLADSQRKQAADQQQVELLAARQRADAARLTLQQAQVARESDPAAQRKQLEVAQLKADQARSEQTRLEQLQRTNPQLVSQTQLEQQRSLVRIAEAERDAADSALARLEQSLTFAVQRAEAEKRAAEDALALAERMSSLAVLDEQVKLAQEKLNQCRLTAPIDGTVISIAAQAGERVASQPLLQIANLKTLKCEAEVDVADVPLLGDRREAFLMSQAFRGARVPATIERIGNTVGAATLRPVDPRKAVDRTVATVVLSVDAAEARRLLGASSSGAGTVLMGLQVDVEIPLAR